jgi:demethylmenaquinone methyltransferase / 2-methoxy-6-polyprenyl-1,4-benzoquinol methylase
VGNRRYAAVEDLGPDERRRVVSDIFTRFHATYDLANHVLSLRRDIAWRRFTVKKMRFFNTMRFLDVATGTADLAILAASRNESIRASGIDFAEPMLGVGREKVRRRSLEDRIELSNGDALDLGFPDSSFDVAAIAFGIRNIPDMGRALREMSRVVVPGGQVMVLEMTFGVPPLLRKPYSFYLRRTLPALARLVVGDDSAYVYLAQSILRHPSASAFDAIMQEAGIEGIRHYALSLGTAFLHVGTKPALGGNEA